MNITPRKNKDGKIYAYRIRVFRYTDDAGKISFYVKTWKIPDSLHSESAIQRELIRVAGAFEDDCIKGQACAGRQTLIDYCNYYIQHSADKNSKTSSMDFYERLLPRIRDTIGYIKLSDLTVKDLNSFYHDLKNTPCRHDMKAVAKDNLLQYRIDNKITHKMISDKCGLSDATLRTCFNKRKISIDSAQKICSVLGRDFKKDFDVIYPEKANIGLSDKYIREYHNFIHAVLDLAYKESAVYINVADRADPPKPKRHEAEFFEISDIMKIKCALESEPMKYRVMLYILLDTGVRRGELMGLRWRSIDFNGCFIKVENNLQQTTKRGLYEDTPKSKKNRKIAVAPELIRILKDWKLQQDEDIRIRTSGHDTEFECEKAYRKYNTEGYLFLSEDGKPMRPNSIDEWCRVFSKKIDMHVYPHKFRHSQASLLFAVKEDVVTISRRLGHEQVSTTQNIYAHLMDNEDKEASEKIRNVIF